MNIGDQSSTTIINLYTQTKLPNSTFVAPETGLYIFDIRYNVFAAGATVGGPLALASRLHLVLENNTANPLDEYEGYQDLKNTNNQLVGFYSNLSAYLTKGQSVSIYMSNGRGCQVSIPPLSSWGSNNCHFQILVKRYNFTNS